MFGLLQESNDLLPSNAGKTFKEIVNGITRFQMIEEALHGDTRPLKNNRPA